MGIMLECCAWRCRPCHVLPRRRLDCNWPNCDRRSERWPRRRWRGAAPLQLCGRSAGCRGAQLMTGDQELRGGAPAPGPRTTAALAPPRARHCTELPSTRGGEIGSKIETGILQSRFFMQSRLIFYAESLLDSFSVWYFVHWSVYPQMSTKDTFDMMAWKRCWSMEI